jgi:hypothetical protein
MLQYYAMFALGLGVPPILGAAAALHWRVARRWPFILFAAASVLAFADGLASQMKALRFLSNVPGLLALLLAGVGAIGVIRASLREGRGPSTSA